MCQSGVIQGTAPSSHLPLHTPHLGMPAGARLPAPRPAPRRRPPGRHPGRSGVEATRREGWSVVSVATARTCLPTMPSSVYTAEARPAML